MLRYVIGPLIALLLVPVQALAYLDPGSGSMIFQAVFAAVVGGFFLVRRYWQKIVSLTSRKWGQK